MFDSQRAAQKSWCCHSHLRFARSRWLSLARSPCQVKQSRNWLETSRNCLEQEWTSKESARTQSIYKNVQGVANHSNKIQSLKRRIKNMGHVTCASVWDCASQSDSTRENNKQNVDHGLLNPLAQRQGCRVWGQIGHLLKRRIYGKPLSLHVFTLKFRSFGKFLPSSDLGIGWWTSEHKLQSFDFGYQRLSRPSANLPWVRVTSLSTPNTSQH